MTILDYCRDIANTVLPGRRRLRHKQTVALRNNFENLQQIVNEYRNLAEIKSIPLHDNHLGSFNIDAFKTFLRQDSELENWTTTQKRLGKISIPSMVGGVNPGDQRLIYHLCRFQRATSVLEIGTHIGASTVHFAAALDSLGDENTLLDTVDIRDVNCNASKPWLNYGSLHSPKTNLSTLNFSELVNFHATTAVEFMKTSTVKYDLIFLDGDHGASSVYQEIPLAVNCLSPKGLILLHDFFPNMEPLWLPEDNNPPPPLPGVFLAAQRLLNEGARLKITPLGELPWHTKLNSKITSLAVISALS